MSKAWLTLAEEATLRKPVNRSAHFAWGAVMVWLADILGAPVLVMFVVPAAAWVAWEMGWWVLHGCTFKERGSVMDVVAGVLGACFGVMMAVAQHRCGGTL